MRIWYKMVAVLVIGAAITGCIDMRVKRYSMKKYMPVDPVDVAVYTDISQVQGDYEKVATIELQDELVHDSPKRILKHVKKKAGEIGANAVIVSKTLNAPEVPAVFHETAEQSDSYDYKDPNNIGLPQPAIDKDPMHQDAWEDVEAIYIKNK